MPHATRKFDDESFESLFKRWNKAVEKSGIIQEYRNREFYEKPSLVRKRKKAAAVKRNQRKIEEERIGTKRKFHQTKEKKKQDLINEQKFS